MVIDGRDIDRVEVYRHCVSIFFKDGREMCVFPSVYEGGYAELEIDDSP